jgi:PAT family beta-lactamase induction signal transducer AmpG
LAAAIVTHRKLEQSDTLVNLNLASNRRLRLTTLCVLYMSQGMPDGFVRTGLKTYLIEHGASTQEIAHLIALVSWPWAIKWVWGPIIDRFSHSSFGRRRPWILGAQFLMGLTMASMLLLPNLSESIRLLGVMVLLINCFSSLQDVAIDALAIDILPARERGVANGLMFACTYVGSFLGGAVVGGLLLKYGIQAAVMLEVLILSGIAMFPLLLREKSTDRLLPGRRPPETPAVAHEQSSMSDTLRELRRAFSRSASLLGGVLAVCSLASTSAFLVFWPVYMQRKLGWSGEDYLLLEGGYSILFGLAGSVIGGVFASWFGAKRCTVMALGLLCLCWLTYFGTADAWDNSTLVTCLFFAVVGLAGFFQVSMFALFMGICSPAVAATQFSAYMALLNVSSSWGSLAAGRLDEESSYTHVFLALAGFQLVLIAVTLMIRRDTKATLDMLPEAPNRL